LKTVRRSGAALAGVLLIALLQLGGCSSAEPVPPHVRVADLRLLDSTIFEQRFEINLTIGNPNDFALPLDGLTFDLEVNGESFARGFSNQRITIPRLGEGNISVAASTTLVELLRQMQLLSGRADLTYRLRGLAYVDNLGGRTMPYESEGNFRLLPHADPGESI
jgi:LEA14-like dessication related protein